jgi:hypothetical protein
MSGHVASAVFPTHKGPRPETWIVAVLRAGRATVTHRHTDFVHHVLRPTIPELLGKSRES